MIRHRASTAVLLALTTSVRKRIANGVTARVVGDSVTRRSELIEDTFDWYAQDDRGRGKVWYLGEDTVEFERGEVTTRSGSFEAGVERRAARGHHARQAGGRHEVSGSPGREQLLRVEQVSARTAKEAGTAPLGERYP